MNTSAIFNTSRWPLFAALASIAALAIAHAFEHFGGLRPCALCLRQREVFWVALGIAILGVGLMRKRPDWPIGRGITALLGLTFLTGAIVAGYHAGVEWHFWPGPSTCSGGGSGLEGLDAADLGAILGTATKAPACDQIPWSFAGLSMAGWNVLYSLTLTIASFVSLGRAKEREIAT